MDILQTTFTASVFILAAVIARALLLHRLPKAAFVWMWYIAALRLLVPVSIPFRFSIYTVLGRLFKSDAPAPVTVPMPATAVVPAENMPSAAVAVEGTAPVESAAHIPVWTILWLAGVCVAAAFFVAAYVRYRRQFDLSRPVEHDMAARWLAEHPSRRPIAIRQTDRVSAPLTYGVLRPAILMPETTDWSDNEKINYILTHEYIHIRRFDTLAKLALIAAVCLHWFNPLVWVMYVLANRDIELSCDEAVVRSMGENEKTAYAMALIAMEERKRALSPLVSHFSKNAIEERIISIMKIKQKSIWSVVLAAVLVVSLATGFATTASAEKGTPAASDTAEKAVQITPEDAAMTELAIRRLEDNYPNVAQWVRKTYPDTVWWTYEGYQAMMEEELDTLESELGQVVGSTPSTAKVVVTQEMIDQRKAEHENTLLDICSGWMVSKSVGGDENQALAFDPADIAMGTGDRAYQTQFPTPKVEWWTAEEYAQWLEQEKLALQDAIGAQAWTSHDGWFTWTQEKVDETVAMYEQILEEIQNGALISKTVDGSSDVMLASGWTDDAQIVYAEADDTAVLETRQEQWDATLAPYAIFGVTYEYDPATDDFKLYWNGKEVRGITDEKAQLWISEHAGIGTYGEDAIELYTVYEGGKLVGVREATAWEQAVWTQIRTDNTNSIASDTMG